MSYTVLGRIGILHAENRKCIESDLKTKYSEKKEFTVIHNKIEKTQNCHFQSEL